MKDWCAEAGLMFGSRQCSYEQQANEGLVCLSWPDVWL